MLILNCKALISIYKRRRELLKFLEDQLAFARDNYKAVLRQFENGLAVSLDVMDANSLLLSSEKNVAEALYNYQLAYLKSKKIERHVIAVC